MLHSHRDEVLNKTTGTSTREEEEVTWWCRSVVGLTKRHDYVIWARDVPLGRVVFCNPVGEGNLHVVGRTGVPVRVESTRTSETVEHWSYWWLAVVREFVFKVIDILIIILNGQERTEENVINMLINNYWKEKQYSWNNVFITN